MQILHPVVRRHLTLQLISPAMGVFPMKNIFTSKFRSKDVMYADLWPKNTDRLLTGQDMKKVILRERSRSDRHNHEFSIIVIDVEQSTKNRNSIDRLARLLCSRLRSIDEIGWYGANQIGIVLPHTSSEDAVRVAEDIAAIIEMDTPAGVAGILSYPSIWPFKK